jgi:hypothetical protein
VNDFDDPYEHDPPEFNNDPTRVEATHRRDAVHRWVEVSDRTGYIETHLIELQTEVEQLTDTAPRIAAEALALISKAKTLTSSALLLSLFGRREAQGLGPEEALLAVICDVDEALYAADLSEDEFLELRRELQAVYGEDQGRLLSWVFLLAASDKHLSRDTLRLAVQHRHLLQELVGLITDLRPDLLGLLPVEAVDEGCVS